MQPNVESDLHLRVHSLLKAAIAEVHRRHEAGEIGIQHEEFLKPTVQGFSYGENQKTSNLRYSRTWKPRWDPKDHDRFMKEVIRGLPEFGACSDLITQRYSIDADQAAEAAYRLTSFMTAIAVETIEDADLEARVRAFLGDLEGRPANHRITAWIEGVFLEVERIEFGDGIVMRRPTPADLELESPADPLIQRNIPPLLGLMPAAVVEYSCLRQQTSEAQETVENLLKVLSLYRLGTISYSWYEVESLSFRMLMGPGKFRICGGSNITSEFKYRLNDADAATLDRFYRMVKVLIPPDSPPTGAKDRKDPVRISYPRYKDALYRGTSYESRIASAITCLEGLFFRSDEQMELKVRLSQRVAVTLRHFDLAPQTVFDVTGDAYKIRSKFVHGEMLSEKHQQEAQRICDSIMNYARMALLVFMQLGIYDKSAKDRFLGEIDSAIIDPSKSEDLRKRLDTVFMTR
jgi:hypothetical protein